MKRARLLHDPELATAFLLRHARTEHPTADARNRALERVLKAATGAAVSAPALAAAAGATTKAGLSVGALVPWALAGMALGATTTGAVAGTQFLRHRAEAAAHSVPLSHSAARAPRSPRLPPENPVSNGPGLETGPPVAPVEPPRPSAPRGGESVERRVFPPPTSEPSLGSNGIADFSASLGPGPAPLQRELLLLDQVRTNLAAGRPVLAEQALLRYDREFSAGMLHVEATALRVELLGKLGRTTEARELGRAFLAHFPESPSAPRVRSLLTHYEHEEK